ncbi:MAG: hypothetical protein NXI10_00035 [bacterium]|nr:hypothetical protein [bacterium]
MLSLKQCRKIIDPKKKKFTDEQVLAIRNYLMELARLNVQIILSSKEKLLNKNKKLWKK